VPFSEPGLDVPFSEPGLDVPFSEPGLGVPFSESGLGVPTDTRPSRCQLRTACAAPGSPGEDVEELRAELLDALPGPYGSRPDGCQNRVSERVL
jgi:hypothetical protein